MQEPKILIFDLEVMHMNWGADLGFLLCMGWKWLGESRVHIESIRKWNAGTFMDDLPLAERCRDILEKADMIITYNGLRFDVPFLQSRLLLGGSKPMSPIAHTDLY